MDQVQNELSSISSVVNWLRYRHSSELLRKTEKIATILYHKFLDSVPYEVSNYATAISLFIARMFSVSGHHISRYELATGCGLSLEEFDTFLTMIYEMSGLDFFLVLLSIMNRKSTPEFSRDILKKFFNTVRISLEFYEYIPKPTSLLGILFEPQFRILMRKAIRSLCRGDLEQAELIIGDMVAEHLHSDILFLLSELYIQQGKLREVRDLDDEAVQLFMEENGQHS